ncbi:hypothetical protein B4168_3494 [Anoxybacillus flavithermus]|nr:hypothetical protein B4168_3494 [Anoxybacillus flavithermus]OAO84622.1 hypothetical protein GT23_3473 [Parageobacillus thermoglucosidasius]
MTSVPTWIRFLNNRLKLSRVFMKRTAKNFVLFVVLFITVIIINKMALVPLTHYFLLF